MEVALETFPVKTAIDEVCSVLTPMAREKNIEIKKCVSDHLDSVILDQQKFRQVLYNLLSNAVKFTGEGGWVEITVGQDHHGRLHLAVKDSGIGIKPDDVGKLFVEFQQLDSSLSRRYHGTGLGLALTRKIVELQGGSIRVESQPGKEARSPLRCRWPRGGTPPHEPARPCRG